jgi:hypothetical protein
MNQLTLTHAQLTEIGFTKATHPEVDEFNPEKVVYSIECLNGLFFYNRDNADYRWYQLIRIGECSNQINLDIPNGLTLFNVLAAFRVNHDFVII